VDDVCANAKGYKLLAEAALRSMPDADAGAACKAALLYMAGGEAPALPPAAQVAFDAMRWLIDLSRKRAAAGRDGGNAGHFAGSKRNFAGSKQDFISSKPAGTPSQSLDQIDVLAALDAFLS